MLEWVTSVVVAATAVLLTTFVLLALNSYLAPEHLILGYLLPTIIIAMHYGSTVAVFTSFISGLAAAYFLFLPKFSFYIADPLNLAELGVLPSAGGDGEQGRGVTRRRGTRP